MSTDEEVSEIERLRSDLEDVTQALKNEIAETDRLKAAILARARVVEAAKAWADDYRLETKLMNAIAKLKRLEAEGKS